MNLYQENLMDAPSIFSEVCPFCGKPTQNRHHIVPRSAGGTDGPVVDVCGLGNTSGCHGALHSHKLHLDWSDEKQWWVYKRTKKPQKDVWLKTSPNGWKDVPKWVSD